MNFVLRGLCLTVALSALVGCADPIPVHHQALENTYYTRVTLRPDGPELYSAAYYGLRPVYKPGTEVQVQEYTEDYVKLLVNKIPYTMNPIGEPFGIDATSIEGFVDKFFVPSLSDLGLVEADPDAGADGGEDEGDPDAGLEAGDNPFDLSAMDRGTRSNIDNGKAVQGMTKAQVLMAMGPPAEINFGEPATNLTLDALMSANRWIYHRNAFCRFFFGIYQQVYTFADGKLTTIQR
ncbi:MAG: hypothetical protein R3F62_05080 [Planctomycetota bacterium]